MLSVIEQKFLSGPEIEHLFEKSTELKSEAQLVAVAMVESEAFAKYFSNLIFKAFY